MKVTTRLTKALPRSGLLPRNVGLHLPSSIALPITIRAHLHCFLSSAEFNGFRQITVTNRFELFIKSLYINISRYKIRMNELFSNMNHLSKYLVAINLIISGCLVVSLGGELNAQERGTISVDRAVALPLTTAEGNQVKVVVNYNIEDESLIGQRVNAIMGIYDTQTGSLIKLSSFPNGFILNNTEGTTQLATTLTDNILQNISAVVTLTNADKSEKYTNDVRADLNLRTILPTTLPPQLEDIPAAGPAEETEGQEGSPSNDDPEEE